MALIPPASSIQHQHLAFALALPRLYTYAYLYKSQSLDIIRIWPLGNYSRCNRTRENDRAASHCQTALQQGTLRPLPAADRQHANLRQSTRDGNAPAKLRRRDLVEIFHQPRRGSPSPDPRKSLKADEHEQIYVHDDYGVHDAYDGPKFTSSSLTEELTQAQVECSTKASLPDKTQWPPRGLDSLSQLSLEEAKNLVGEGALSFEGLIVQAIHTSFRQARRFATVGVGAAEDGIEAVGNSETSPPDMSLALVDRPGHTKPSETLEQPSMTQCFGMLPGTVTLNHYINTMSRSSQPTNFPEYAILPRQTDSLLVLQRLHYLQGGLDADVRPLEYALS